MTESKPKTAALLVLAGGFAACVISDLDYTGKPCPSGACPDGWTCTSGVCARPLAGGDGGAGGTGCSAVLQVRNLKASWQTTNTIRWEWSVTGDTSQFNGYELVLTSDRAGAAGAKTWTYADNPELAYYMLPTSLHADYDLFTTTYGLDEATQYHARLVVKDKAGATCSTPIADARTAVRSGLRVVRIFDDGFPPGGAPTQDRAIQIVSGAGGYGSSTSHMEVHWGPGAPDYPCAQADAICYSNFHTYGVNVDTSELTQVAFDNSAFFEIALSYSPDAGAQIGPSWWSSVGICAAGAADKCFVFEPFTVRTEATGDYRVVQIPLRVIGTTPLSFADVKAGIQSFFVGGEWSKSSVIRLDKIHLVF